MTPNVRDPIEGGAGGAIAETDGAAGRSTSGSGDSGGRAGPGGTGSGGTATGGSGTRTGGMGGTGGMAATPGMSLLMDGFENGTGQWLTSGGGTARVAIDGSHVYDLSDPMSKVFLAAAGDVSWTNVIVRAKMKIISWAGSSSSDYAGICGRVADGDDYTCVIVRSDGKLAIRADASGSSATVGSTVSANLTPGTWYTIALQIDGNGVTASLDGAMVLPKAGDAATAASPTGGIGLIVANAEAEFEDVTVTVP